MQLNHQSAPISVQNANRSANILSEKQPNKPTKEVISPKSEPIQFGPTQNVPVNYNSTLEIITTVINQWKSRNSSNRFFFNGAAVSWPIRRACRLTPFIDAADYIHRLH